MKNTKNKCAKMRSVLATQIRSICAIALVAIVGLSFAACGGGDDDPGGGGTLANQLSGTWKGDDGTELTLTNGNFVHSENNKQSMKGTYTASARSISATITMTVTELHGNFLTGEFQAEGMAITFENKWYNKSQVIDAVKKWMKDGGVNDTEIDTTINGLSAAFNAMFPTITGTITDNTMIVDGTTYTKEGGSTNPGTNPGDGNGGVLTVTDIPSEYNGKYASCFGREKSSDPLIYGYTGRYQGVRISNGTVSMPMWTGTDAGSSRYFGDQTDAFYIMDITETDFIGTGSITLKIQYLNNVTLRNGSGTTSWNKQ